MFQALKRCSRGDGVDCHNSIAAAHPFRNQNASCDKRIVHVVNRQNQLLVVNYDLVGATAASVVWIIALKMKTTKLATHRPRDVTVTSSKWRYQNCFNMADFPTRGAPTTARGALVGLPRQTPPSPSTSGPCQEFRAHREPAERHSETARRGEEKRAKPNKPAPTDRSPYRHQPSTAPRVPCMRPTTQRRNENPSTQHRSPDFLCDSIATLWIGCGGSQSVL